MRTVTLIALVFLATSFAGAPAWAFATPQTNAALPTQHQQEFARQRQPASPYAMNYTDEAAQTLGVRDGKWEAFNTHSSDPLMPSLKGGIDHGGAMISLQWRPGQ